MPDPPKDASPTREPISLPDSPPSTRTSVHGGAPDLWADERGDPRASRRDRTPYASATPTPLSSPPILATPLESPRSTYRSRPASPSPLPSRAPSLSPPASPPPPRVADRTLTPMPSPPTLPPPGPDGAPSVSFPHLPRTHPPLFRSLAHSFLPSRSGLRTTRAPLVDASDLSAEERVWVERTRRVVDDGGLRDWWGYAVGLGGDWGRGVLSASGAPFPFCILRLFAVCLLADCHDGARSPVRPHRHRDRADTLVPRSVLPLRRELPHAPLRRLGRCARASGGAFGPACIARRVAAVRRRRGRAGNGARREGRARTAEVAPHAAHERRRRVAVQRRPRRDDPGSVDRGARPARRRPVEFRCARLARTERALLRRGVEHGAFAQPSRPCDNLVAQRVVIARRDAHGLEHEPLGRRRVSPPCRRRVRPVPHARRLRPRVAERGRPRARRRFVLPRR